MLHHQFQKRRLFPPSTLQKVDLFKVSRDLLNYQVKYSSEFEKKHMSFFDDKLDDVVAGETRRTLVQL